MSDLVKKAQEEFMAPDLLRPESGLLSAEEEDGVLSAPRLRLVQPASAKFKQDNPDAKDGQFHNSGTSLFYDEVTFVPVGVKKEYLTFNDDMQVDQRFSTTREAKAALGLEYWRALNGTIYMLIDGEDLPCAFNMRGTAFGVFREWYKQVAGYCKLKNKSICSHKFTMTTRGESNKKGAWFVPVISRSDELSKKEYERHVDIVAQMAPFITADETVEE